MSELAALAAAGKTSAEIADHYGISIRAAQRRAAVAGITLDRRSTANRAEVARLTAQGWSAPQIAKQLGIGARQVVRHRTDAGLTKPRPKWTPEEVARYEHAITVEGWSYSETARTYGADKITLAQHFPGHGWPPGGGVTYRRMMERTDRIDAEYWANRYARAAGQNWNRAAA